MKDYRFLKSAKVIFKVLAWIILILAVVVGAIILITGGGSPTITAQGVVNQPTGRAAGAVFMIVGAFYFLIFYSLSEIINILLDIKGTCDKPVV